MASTTPNLNLKLLGTSLEDKEQYFEDWRQDINGEGEGSNMRIIDTAYGELVADVVNKVYKPASDPDGNNGQVLTTNGDGTTRWTTPLMPSDELVEQVITDWMNNHPEAVTTVEDGSISVEKLTSDILALLNKINPTETALNALTNTVSQKIDNGYVEDGVGYFTSNGVIRFTMEGMGGGGGGGGGGGDTDGGSASITYITSAAPDCIYGESLVVEFGFAATDASGQTVGNGTGTWSVGGITVARNVTVRQGTNSFDIGPYLSPGPNRVKLSVSVDTGGVRARTVSKTWTINAVNMYISWNYNDAQINTDGFTDRWTVYGEVNKTTHTLIDGTPYGDITTERSGYVQTMDIPKLSHGIHTVERWMTATINDVEQTTPHLYHEFIFVDEENMTPIIAMPMQETDMKQYDTLAIPYIVYDPANTFAEVEFLVDGVSSGTIPDVDRSLQYWYYTPTIHGAQLLTIRCGETSRVLKLNVEDANVDVNEVSGYIFRFKSSDFVSNNAVRSWESNGINATFSPNFDWINGGLQTERDSNGFIQQYFCVKAGTRMTINYKLFSFDPRSDGMNFKIIFKAQNCRDYDANLMHCYADGIGIRMDAHKAYFNSSGTEVNVPYGEDSYKELEFDVYPAPRQNGDGNFRYMMAWLDGVITSCRVYGASDNFVQSNVNQENIVIGSDDCDVHIYMVKAYPMLINRDSHIDNFITDAPNAAEMARRYMRNDILDVSGEISYEKLVDNNPDLRVWTWDIPYLTNGKKNTVENCHFQQFWKNGDNYYNLDGIGTMTIQGTSSVNYIRGAANTDVDFVSLLDGDGNDLLEGGTKDSAYGNNWFVEDEDNPGHAKVYTVEEAEEEADLEDGETLGPEWVVVERDSNRNPLSYIKSLGFKIGDTSCPITYSNTKVNFASCEQVNNMCNAAWYQRFNPYPSLTARDCMEFEIGVQFIRDTGEVPDSAHFVLFGDDKFHMYSIANMGNSKKNVHVFHDLSNTNEVCIEINDNNTDQMRMTNDDLSAEDWSGDVYFGMRYPDTKKPRQEIKDAWQRLVTWMATRNPAAATGNRLERVETYEPYTFRGHDRSGLQVLRGTTVNQYAGVYTHDTFERRMARMLSECEDYMVMDSFVYHFVYLERHTMVDNVAKNTFWSSTDLLHWDLSKAYDMDTSDGNNNQGQLAFDYGNEYDDYDEDGRRVFNAADSVWFVFVANLYEACSVMFTNREAAGAWSAVAYHNFLTSQQNKVPERCWVQCYWYDYLRTYEQGIVSEDEWMPFLDGGKKTHQRDHYEYYEELYDASKYRGTVSTSRKINFRSYTPATWINVVSTEEGAPIYATPDGSASIIDTLEDGTVVTVLEKVDDQWRKILLDGDETEYYILRTNLEGVEPSNDITVTMYNKMYLSANIGTTRPNPIKVQRGVPYKLTFYDLGVLNNTLIEINTAPMIQEVEGIEHLYPDTCVFSDAIRLRTLHVGSSATGYVNTYLRSLALSNNTLLEYLYAQNLPNANATLNLSNCPSLIYLDATGSGFTGYDFADGGKLTYAICEAPTSLTLINLAHLTDENFIIHDFSRLTSLRHEHTPLVDSLELVKSAELLQIARLIGIDWDLPDTDVLDRLYAMQGMNEGGYTVARSILTGHVYLPIIGQRKKEDFDLAWPNVIDPANVKEQRSVTFVNLDGSPIYGLNGQPYIQYVDVGDSAYDPVTAVPQEMATPTYGPDAQYVYTWTGWTNISGTVVTDKTVTAAYSTVTRMYTVRFLARTGDVRKAYQVPYGSSVEYNPDNLYDFPDITDDESGLTVYAFLGWDKSTSYITGDMDVYAMWDRATLPEPGTVALKNMTPGQIKAVTMFDAARNQWNIKDYFDIELGKGGNNIPNLTSVYKGSGWVQKVPKDFDFENVASMSLVSEPTYFDGTNVLNTGVKLFAEDSPSFTLAIDYEYYDSATQNATLISAYEQNGAKGVRMRISNYTSPYIEWGNSNVRVGYKARRQMIVLRHAKGSNILSIYHCNNSNIFTNPSENSGGFIGNQVGIATTSRTQFTSTDAELCFGGIPLGGNEIADPAIGWIHYAKVWYDELSDNVCKQLAQSSHNVLRMAYRGPRNTTTSGHYTVENENTSSGADFFALNGLNITGAFNESTSSNLGGYPASSIRNIMNNRVYDALPIWLQSIIAPVMTASNIGYASAEGTATEIEYSANKVYLMAYAELVSTTAQPYASEGIIVPWLTGNYLNARCGDIVFVEESIMNTATDPTLVYDHIEEGQIWNRGSTQYTSNMYVYISQETADRHRQFGHVSISSTSNIEAAGAQGGLWLSYGGGVATLTRSPSATNNGIYKAGYAGGNSHNTNAVSILVPGFSLRKRSS